MKAFLKRQAKEWLLTLKLSLFAVFVGIGLGFGIIMGIRLEAILQTVL